MAKREAILIQEGKENNFIKRNSLSNCVASEAMKEQSTTFSHNKLQMGFFIQVGKYTHNVKGDNQQT